MNNERATSEEEELKVSHNKGQGRIPPKMGRPQSPGWDLLLVSGMLISATKLVILLDLRPSVGLV